MDATEPGRLRDDLCGHCAQDPFHEHTRHPADVPHRAVDGTGAARVLRPRLEDGQTSLTLTMNMTHAVTGPISGNLRAVATFQGASGREYRFLVHVFDESGLVASAEHSRAIVGARRIAGLARKRAGKPSMQLSV